MKTSNTLEEIAAIISGATSAVVVSHESPDSDAHGSAFALCAILKQAGCPSVTYLNADGIEGKFRLLPHPPAVVKGMSNYTGEREVLFYVDCATAARVGSELAPELVGFQKTVSIDHHSSNEFFANYNWVDVAASSTCEMVARLAVYLKMTLDPSLATNMLAGIVGDTGSFRYSQTRPETLRMAATLLEHGADLSLVSGRLYSIVPRSIFDFRRHVVSRAEFIEDGAIVGLVINYLDFQQFSVDAAASEGIVEMLRDVDTVRVAYVIREAEPGLWRVSLRSQHDRDDVSEIAATFGGGGHRSAAAFHLKVEDFLATEQQLKELLTRLVRR